MTQAEAGRVELSLDQTSDCLIVCTQVQNVLTALRQHRHVKSEAPLVKPNAHSSLARKGASEEKSAGERHAVKSAVKRGSELSQQQQEKEKSSGSAGEQRGANGEIEMLIRGLVQLRERLHRLINSDAALSRARVVVNMSRLLKPFLNVVTATKAGAAPTGVALAAVHRILSLPSVAHSHATAKEKEAASNSVGNYGQGQGEREQAVLVQVVDAVIHCNFQQTDTGADEIAIMWILEVLKYCVQCPAGNKLSDQAVWNIVSTMYQISAGKTNADMLRGMATRSLGDLLQNLFARVFVPSTTGQTLAHGHGLPVAIKTFEYICTRIDSGTAEIAHMQEVTLNSLQLVASMIEASIDSKQGHVKLEECPQIVALIQNKLLRALLEICQTTRKSASLIVGTQKGPGPGKSSAVSSLGNVEEMEGGKVEILGRVPQLLLAGSLRIVYLLFAHRNMRKHLKAQIEAFFNSVFFRVLDGKVSSQDEARIVLETLLNLLADPLLTADLYVNYDCDLQATNVFQNLFKYLSRYTLPMRPHPPKLSALQLLSLECIMYGIRCMSDRCEERVREAPDNKARYSTAELMKRRVAKQALTHCADMFNQKPREGIRALKEAGLLEDNIDPGVLANFLRKTPGLDKVKIGLFLGEGADLNSAVLTEFVNSFEMKGQTLLEALRMFLESFRLPGEAQQIDRVLQCFAEIAYQECEAAAELPSPDCTYLLSFSIIMLNTDLHNPNIRPEKKMSLDQFIKNNTNYGADTNLGKDLPKELLEGIYRDIKQTEINTMAEGSSVTAEITPDKWRDLVSSYAGDLQPWFQNDPASAALYDKQMLSLCWTPAVAAMSVIFDSGDLVEQPLALSSAQDGFILCSKIASRFEMCEVIDSIAVSLCKFTSLLLYAPHGNKSETKKQADLRENGEANGDSPGEDVHVVEDTEEIRKDRLGSHQSVARAERRLETHTKAQVATVFAFALATKYGSNMCKSWAHITYCLLRMADLSLVSSAVCLESEASPVDPEMRRSFHESLRAKLVRETLELAKKEKERSDSGVGWFSNWLFGDTANTESVLHSDEHYAMLSSVRIAESAFAEIQDRNDKALSPKQSTAAPNDAAPNSPKKRKKKDTLEFMRRCRLERFVESSSNLSDEALKCFMEALVYATRDEQCKEEETYKDFATISAADSQPLEQELNIGLISPPSRASTIFGLHLITKVALLNINRLHVFWPTVKKRLIGILDTAGSPTFRVEKAAVGLLKIATCGVSLPEHTLLVVEVFNRLLLVNNDTAPGLGSLVVASLKTALASGQGDLKDVLRQDGVWQQLSQFVHNVSDKDEECAVRGFGLATFLVKETPVQVRPSVRDSLHMLMPYVNRLVETGENEADSEEALALVFSLHTRIGETYQQNGSLEAGVVEGDWIPLLEAIAGVVVNVSKTPPIRFSALNLLKTALMDVLGQGLSGRHWAAVFEKVLFVLCSCALTPPSKGSPSEDLESANARAYGVMVLVSDVAKRCHSQLKRDLPSQLYNIYWKRLVEEVEKFKLKFPKEVPMQVEQLRQLQRGG